MTKVNLKEIVESLIDTFLNAGQVALDLRKKGLTKTIKSDNTPVSNGDLEVNKIITNKIDIEHKILYFQNKFKQGVIDNFVESYLKGETPIPCVQCNQTVKFKDLFEVSKELKADALVTGHYVKSITKDNTTNMYRAIDENRDQSYFLFNTTRQQLD